MHEVWLEFHRDSLPVLGLGRERGLPGGGGAGFGSCGCVCTQLHPTRDSMDCSPPGSSVRGIFQARMLSELPFPAQGIFLTQGSNPHLSCIARGFFTCSAT